MKLKLTALCTIASACIATPAIAQNCAPRDAVLTQLANRFGESRQSIGLGANNAVVEVFASAETGSWTITVTLTNGMTCMVASGQSYEAVAESLPVKGDDT